MRICLVRCQSHFLIKDKVFPPLGLLTVGTYLKQQGHDVYIHDGPREEVPQDYLHYGFGPTTPEYGYALAVKNDLKGKFILGGPHANIDCWKDGWDHVVIGNIVDVNLIADRSLIDIKSYRYYLDGRLTTTLVTSTGCPYKCAFCSKISSGVKFRKTEKVIEEIDELHYKFGYTSLMFYDDIFMLNRKRTLKISKRLKELGIIWRCFVRGDLVVKHGEKMLGIMADSGCVEMCMGIESGSDAILKNINKGETVEDMRTAVNMIHAQGIRVKGFFIVGLPGENKKTLFETERFVSEMPLDDMDFAMFQPYPGTDIFKNKDRYDINWNGLVNSKMYHKGKPGDYHSLVRTSALSPEQIVQAREDLEAMYKNG